MTIYAPTYVRLLSFVTVYKYNDDGDDDDYMQAKVKQATANR